MMLVVVIMMIFFTEMYGRWKNLPSTALKDKHFLEVWGWVIYPIHLPFLS